MLWCPTRHRGIMVAKIHATLTTVTPLFPRHFPTLSCLMPPKQPPQFEFHEAPSRTYKIALATLQDAVMWTVVAPPSPPHWIGHTILVCGDGGVGDQRIPATQFSPK